MRKLIVIAGPTASGKTELAIQIAEHFKTEIISADSRQCYRELEIGTAKPSAEQLSRVKHHFISSHTIHEKFSAGQFAQQAELLANSLFQQHNTLVLCGGTGLYIKSLLEGLDEFPAISIEISQRIQSLRSSGGLDALCEALKKQDPERYSQIDIKNPARVTRALEIAWSEQRSFDHYLKDRGPKHRDWTIERYCIELPRTTLYERINERTNFMMKEGLLEEVKSLFKYKSLSTLRTVGYTELFEFLEGTCLLDEATDRIRQHTRNYAKRQMTWFRNQGNFSFMPAEAIFQTAIKGK